MNKYYSLKDVDIKKLYIVSQPTPLSKLKFDDLDADPKLSWRKKAQDLQVRRWRRIKHQLT